MRLSPPSLRLIPSLFFSATIGVAALMAGAALQARPAFAQSGDGIPGEVISKGSTPFTETFANMLKRDAPRQRRFHNGIRPSKSDLVVPNVLGKDLEREFPEPLKHPVDVKPAHFVPSPLRGSLDKAGHFVPTVRTGTGITPTGSIAIASLTPNAPQTPGAISIDGLKLSTTQGYIPPDTQGAVGANYAMLFVNDSIAIYNKSNGSQVGSSVFLDSFFNVSVNGTTYPRDGSYDPRVVYDRRSGRWYATDMEVNGSAANNVILVISRTGDPTGTWDKYVIPVGEASAFTDYSSLGVDDNGVYIGATIFPSGGSPYVKCVATPKAPLIAASPSLGAVTQWSNITDAYGTPQPALNLDGSGNGLAWFLYSSNYTYSNLCYRTISWNGSTPTISSTITLTTSAFDQPPQALAKGTDSTLPIDTGDMRIMMAVLRNNRVWTTRNVGVGSDGTGNSADRCGCEWFALNASNATATVAQTGRIYDNAASDPRFYYYPSVTVTGQGHMALGFSGSKSTEYVSAYTVGRLATDAPNTTQGNLLVKAGVASYTVDYGSGRDRWGDYSYTAVDPNDDQTLWTFQEYAYGTNNWAVWGQQLKAPAPTVVAPASTYASQGKQGQTGVSFQVPGTGFFDPGTGFASHLSGAVSGTGISNVSVTYVSPTTANVKYDVAANAPLGAQSLTLTNPDGQSVVLANAVNVVAAAPVAVTTATAFARVGANIQVTFTLTNPAGSGTTYTGLQVGSATLQVGATTTATTTTLPVTVSSSLAPGASANVTLTFPGTVGTTGTAAIFTISGKGTPRGFSSGLRVALP